MYNKGNVIQDDHRVSKFTEIFVLIRKPLVFIVTILKLYCVNTTRKKKSRTDITNWLVKHWSSVNIF